MWHEVSPCKKILDAVKWALVIGTADMPGGTETYSDVSLGRILRRTRRARRTHRTR